MYNASAKLTGGETSTEGGDTPSEWAKRPGGKSSSKLAKHTYLLTKGGLPEELIAY